MRRAWPWLLGAVVLLATAVLTSSWTLPPLVRWLAIRQIRANTGREASIARLAVDPWHLRVQAEGLRFEGRRGEPPPLTVERIEARLRLVDLLRGRVGLILASARIGGFHLRVVRRPDGTIDAADVLARLALAGRQEGEPAEAGHMFLTLADFRLETGQVEFQDQAVHPAATWRLDDLTLTVFGVSTREDGDLGTATLSARLNGVPLKVALTDVDLAPLAGRGSLTLEGLDLEPAWSYLPSGGARPAGGRLTLSARADHQAGRGTRIDLDLSVADPLLPGPAGREPRASAEKVAITVRDLAGQGRHWRLGRLEAATEATVVLGSGASPAARRLEVRPLRVLLEDLSIAGDDGGRPGRLALAAGLPGGGTLDLTGTLALDPLAASLDLTLSGLDTTLLGPLLGPDPAVAPTRGRLAGRLTLALGGEGSPRASGELTATDLVLARRGQAVPFATHRTARLRIEGLALEGGALEARRLTLVGAPRIVDAGPTPPIMIDFQSLRLDAEHLAWPSERPGWVRVAGATTDGSTLSIEGTFNPGTLAAHVEVEARGIDLAPLTAYVPAAAPVRPARGRVDADLALAHEPPVLHVDGDLSARDLTLLRRGQDEPFVEHRELGASIRGLTLTGGDLAVERLTLDGAPTIVDAGATPPARVSFTRLAMTAQDFSWPSTGATRVLVEASADGGQATLRGTIHPGTLVADVEARLARIDVGPAGGYLPPRAGLALAGGHLDALLRFRHDRSTGFRLDGTAALDGLRLLRREHGGVSPEQEAGAAPVVLEEPHLTLGLEDIGWHEGTLRIARLRLAGAPTLADGSGDPASRVTLRALTLEGEAITIPGRDAGRLRLTAELPDTGTLGASGTLSPDGRRARLDLTLKDAAVDPWQGWLPIAGPVGGRLAADLELALDLGQGFRLEARGTMDGRDLRLGPTDRPALALGSVSVAGLDVRWPGEVRVKGVRLDRLEALLERDSDGTLPLRRHLAGRSSAAAAGEATDGPGAAARPGPPAEAAHGATPPVEAAPPSEAVGGGRTAPMVRADEVTLRNGVVRFLDRSGEPFYSEEVDRLALDLRGLSSEPGSVAQLTLQGILGNTAALELSGEVAAFATPFVLDVAGELREFPLNRTNPLFRRLFAWLLTRGSLTTRLHYRIVGDRLEASNRVEVTRLGVARDARREDPGRRLDLPLGLIVALATDAHGDIAFDIPIKGRLGSPELSVGGAVWAALKNLLVNVATGPFQAVGSLIRHEDEAQEVRLDPIPFPAGSATLDAEAGRQVQRLADFLRAHPNVAVTLSPTISEDDRLTLGTREITARIQALQRDQGLPGFAEAAARLYRETLPGEPPPTEVDAIVAALREREPVPETTLGELGTRRVQAVRDAFVVEAGVAPARLRVAPPGQGSPSDQEAGVTLQLVPGPR